MVLQVPSQRVTILAFLEQSDIAAYPLDFLDQLFHSIKSAYGSKTHNSNQLHRTHYCQVEDYLGLWSVDAWTVQWSEVGGLPGYWSFEIKVQSQLQFAKAKLVREDAWRLDGAVVRLRRLVDCSAGASVIKGKILLRCYPPIYLKMKLFWTLFTFWLWASGWQSGSMLAT
ncbi:unnamed protein product [Fraxinus pennsylvanica]|uniref:Uncharacterized protein n=1 Tax=Fraxinus pennsylvanica TaxID=56036 RepID=A0AAD1YSE8_9LAMI|nr:unnamed protein product [Fraxinus pennsylvanica]